MTQSTPEHSDGIDPALVNAALAAYLKSEPGKPDAWIRHPNNLISVVAIVLSILGVVYGFYKDRKDSIDRNLQALTTITIELAKLNTEYYSTARRSPRENEDERERLGEVWRSLASRRLALLAQADRLIAELGDRVPSGQLSVLGVAFDQAYELDKALQYFEKTTTPSNSTVLRMLGWRSIGVVNIKRGPNFYPAAREAFSKAIHVVPELNDYGPVQASFEVFEDWSGFEIQQKNYREAIRILLQGKEQVRRYACEINEPELLTWFDDLIRSELDTIKARDPDTSDLLRGEVERAGSGSCPQ
jgi:tetratricopeptide (TPR) repeat protein